MTQVLTDTSYFVALYNHKDEFHKKVTEWAEIIETEGITCHITIPILFEVGDGFARLNRRERGMDLIQNILHGSNFIVHAFSKALCEKALDIYVRSRDKEWGLTDCYSFQLMTEQRLADALTSDPHFRQYGFNLLLTKP